MNNVIKVNVHSSRHFDIRFEASTQYCQLIQDAVIMEKPAGVSIFRTEALFD
jgi:hypothetical protein